MGGALKVVAFAFALAFACAFALACAPAPAVAFGTPLRADGLRLTVGQPASFVLEGSPSGRVFTKGTTMFVVTPTEIQSPRETDGSSVVVFRMKGDKVVGNGKVGTFDATNDTLTFDNGLSVTIRDGVPFVSTSEGMLPLKMKFESLPTGSKRAALLITLLILAVAEHR